MKTLLSFLFALLLFSSCKFESGAVIGSGYLELKTSREALQELSGNSTKNTDTDKYLVYIYNQNNKLISGYPKVYGEMAKQVTLTTGQYTVKVYSTSPNDFPFPTQEESNAWVYFGMQSFTIASDEVSKVDIKTGLLTSKLLLDLSEDFCLGYPDYTFNISGVLLHAQNKNAVFVEGGKKIQIILSYTENSKKVYRTFKSEEPLPLGEVVTMHFDYEGGSLEVGDSNFNITTDSEMGASDIYWNINDGELSDKDPVAEKGGIYNPYNVTEARAKQDGSEVWVQGYIVGYIKSSITIISDYSEAKDSNIAIALEPGETDPEKMLFVELGANSDVRTDLGISSTKGASLGYLVKLKGILETYYTKAGLKGVSKKEEYEVVR